MSSLIQSLALSLVYQTVNFYCNCDITSLIRLTHSFAPRLPIAPAQRPAKVITSHAEASASTRQPCVGPPQCPDFHTSSTVVFHPSGCRGGSSLPPTSQRIAQQSFTFTVHELFQSLDLAVVSSAFKELYLSTSSRPPKVFQPLRRSNNYARPRELDHWTQHSISNGTHVR